MIDLSMSLNRSILCPELERSWKLITTNQLFKKWRRTTMDYNNYSEGINNVTNNTNNYGGIIMTMDVFATAIKKTVEGILGNGHEVKVQEVIKNNNTHLTGLMVKTANDPVAPTIYLEQFLEEYREGQTDIEGVSRQIVSIYERSIGKVSFDVSSVTDFSDSKEKICYKLINAERNEQLLSDVPHVLINDLAMIFFI